MDRFLLTFKSDVNRGRDIGVCARVCVCVCGELKGVLTLILSEGDSNDGS